MHPQELKIEDFTYTLPDSHIAYHAAEPKDSARLLIYGKEDFTEDTYRNIGAHLPTGAVLVFNDTKVIKSRLLFQKETGGNVEIFCLEPVGENLHFEEELNRRGSAQWKCLVRRAGKVQGVTLVKKVTIGGTAVTLKATVGERLGDTYPVSFNWSPPEFTFGSVLANSGVMPLPPYIRRTATEEDEMAYQTVYSEHEGSVAAPTAGLHFTERVFEDLKTRGIQTLFTTLHVGAGTFMPVKSATMNGHAMHAEYINITTNFLEALLAVTDQPIIPVGTTSMRTLESIYWMGNKIRNQPGLTAAELKVRQWEPYETAETHSAKVALGALLDWMRGHSLQEFSVETEIIIAPPYRFQLARGLVTNFHQPNSTLLLLVAALIGEDWRRMYDHALKASFRFLSYGDGCLLLP
ncbi:S-adenosylmethionine:tRNA ribosyltransferase-isomerase [Kaistella palustris]|uniref:S-adenosylmethionine:tRNA ribosyltransferase-isomerase n=1 Tax=Kaistella palustris TaxID=493376 RepID=UPI000420FF56|nr:S-adenosylmethionine:tRNA ribosyltransferase-isomerase [Kaistella palustris]